MARISIELPDRYTFHTDIPLLLMHINLGGHLDNALLLTLVAEARQRYFASLGYTSTNLDGVLTYVGDMCVVYCSEARYRETMVVSMAFREFNKYGFDIVWRVSDKTTDREVARGKTGIVCVDPEEKKVALIPAGLKQRLTESQHLGTA